MRRLLLIAAALWGIATVAAAQDISIVRGTSATSYTLDGVGTTTGVYSLKRALTAYSTNKLINIRRASDSTTTDIGRTATGALDVATASTFCNATTCFIATWYDQSGGGRDLVQATAGSQPALIFNCLGTLPCIRTTAATHSMAVAGNVTPATGLMSFSNTAVRTAGSAACFFRANGAASNSISQNTVSGTWALVGGTSGTITASASEGSWHVMSDVLNGGSSVVSIDNVETTGTATGSTTAGLPAMFGGASTTCNQMELVFWDNYALTAAQRTYLSASARAWWGF